MDLYEINDLIKNACNYIYGDGNHAKAIGKYFMNKEGGGYRFDGFVSFSPRVKSIYGKKVISFEEFKNMNANVLITQFNWQDIYDKMYKYIDASRIYINTTWIPRNSPCAICNNSLTFSSNAEFAPFLKERMFLGKEKSTMLMHCPKCRSYYSYYRPNDKEMSRLYLNYRDDEYVKQRNKYESEYTEEFNRSLFEPADGGKGRKQRISTFIEEYIDLKKIKNILDFGGDKGQFIPDIFENVSKYVFEISGTYVVEGVQLITEFDKLKNIKWDVIFCNMVLEHLSDVPGYFENLISLMEEETLLYIEVPSEKFMENSEFIYIHEHINFFREETFLCLAEMKGIHVVKAETGSIIRVLFKK